MITNNTKTTIKLNELEMRVLEKCIDLANEINRQINQYNLQSNNCACKLSYNLYEIKCILDRMSERMEAK